MAVALLAGAFVVAIVGDDAHACWRPSLTSSDTFSSGNDDDGGGKGEKPKVSWARRLSSVFSGNLQGQPQRQGVSRADQLVNPNIHSERQ